MEQMFKVGDKVRIKSKRRIYREAMTIDGYHYTWQNSSVCFTKDMEDLCGQEFTITNIYTSPLATGMIVKGLATTYTITTNMIEYARNCESIKSEIIQLEQILDETNYRLEELREELENIKESEKFNAINDLKCGDRVLMKWSCFEESEYIFARVGRDKKSGTSLYDLINLTDGGQAIGGMEKEDFIEKIKEEIRDNGIVKFEIISK